MKRLTGERGAVSVGMIVGIFLAAFFLYEASQFGPLLIKQYEFQDAVVEAAKFSRGKEAGAVQSELMEKVAELGLPISRDMIKVTRQPTNTRIEVNYELKAEWAPGKEYKWQVTVDEASMLF